jgi:phosphoadenosine phosphosulfate reductase
LALIDKVNTALERIKSANEIREHLFGDIPFWCAYSGGKDSDTIRILMDMSGVPYELWHNHTTVDAPETVRYVRSMPGINISYPELTMWQLIVKKGMPPTRLMRYCCSSHYSKKVKIAINKAKRHKYAISHRKYCYNYLPRLINHDNKLSFFCQDV